MERINIIIHTCKSTVKYTQQYNAIAVMCLIFYIKWQRVRYIILGWVFVMDVTLDEKTDLKERNGKV